VFAGLAREVLRPGTGAGGVFDRHAKAGWELRDVSGRPRPVPRRAGGHLPAPMARHIPAQREISVADPVEAFCHDPPLLFNRPGPPRVYTESHQATQTLTPC
jgi:hypothetical protein